jgi:hypothetical protein
MQSLQDIWDTAAELRDRLVAGGEIEAALRITETLSVFWTSRTEALVELVRALRETRPSWSAQADPSVGLLGERLIAKALRFQKIVERWRIDEQREGHVRGGLDEPT